MSDCDLMIRNALVVNGDGIIRTDVAVADGKITEVGAAGGGRLEVDAEGLHLFPGVIDSHVHFNEPGRTEWEGIASGSRAVAAGGGTLFFDMPLNSHPPVIDGAGFDLKREAAERAAMVDFGIWGGLVPGNRDELEALAERGVIGLKAFLCGSGIDDFPRADSGTLREGMRRAAALGMLVAVHAEDDALTSELVAKCRAEGRMGVRDFLESRPIAAETRSIAAAIEIAGETGCRLHVVHVSSGKGVALVAAARKKGVDVTCETCPHYLVLTEEDLESLGAVAKCAPPLRSAAEQAGLWEAVLDGGVSTAGSDHSPSPPDMKEGVFLNAWGGISGCQHLLPLLLDAGWHQRGMALDSIVRLVSGNVAERFGVANRKGRIAPGLDADFALVDMGSVTEVTREDLLYRHKQSPYIGKALRGRLLRTFLRGQTVFEHGKSFGQAGGRLVTPRRTPASPSS